MAEDTAQQTTTPTTTTTTTTTYTISLLLWGGSGGGGGDDDNVSPETNPNNPSNPNPDPPGHIALAIHPSFPLQPKFVHLHHARCPSQIRFIYESRPQQPFEADPCPRGYCVISSSSSSKLSPSQARKANEILSAYGAEEENLPWYGEGNCHDWTAGAVRRLEEEGFTGKGDGGVWEGFVGKGPKGMEEGWKGWKNGENGEEWWVGCEKWEREDRERKKEGGKGGGKVVVDARWGYGSGDGKGSDEKGGIEDFGERVGRLEKLFGKGRG